MWALSELWDTLLINSLWQWNEQRHYGSSFAATTTLICVLPEHIASVGFFWNAVLQMFTYLLASCIWKRAVFLHRQSSVHTRISEHIPCLNAMSWVGVIHHHGLCCGQAPWRGQCNYSVQECCKAELWLMCLPLLPDYTWECQLLGIKGVNPRATILMLLQGDRSCSGSAFQMCLYAFSITPA